MKDPLERTKVVLRHLPPAISQLALMDQIDARFAGRYTWVSFRPGKARSGFCLFYLFIYFLIFLNLISSLLFLIVFLSLSYLMLAICVLG